MPVTSEAAVHTILALIERSSGDPVVAGGWGIDALIGRTTREHSDLDIAIRDRAEGPVLAALQSAGYEITTDWRPVRVALANPDGSEVDVHPLRYRPDGSAVLAGLDGEEFIYPADGFTTGSIGGRPVRCITAALQAEFHRGYPLQEKDLADMEALVAATGMEWTAE